MNSKLRFIYDSTTYNFTAINLGYSVSKTSSRLNKTRSAAGIIQSPINANNNLSITNKRIISIIIEGVDKTELDAMIAFYNLVEGSKQFLMYVIDEIGNKIVFPAAIFETEINYNQTDQLYYNISMNIKEQ